MTILIAILCAVAYLCGMINMIGIMALAARCDREIEVGLIEPDDLKDK